MTVNPYLNFDGNCAEAFAFYEMLLDGKIVMMMKHRDSPMAEQTPPEWLDAVMHVAMKLGDTMLFASDAPPKSYAKPAGLWVSLEVATPEEAERVWAGFADGGQVAMPLQEMFWAKRFGMVTDKFGTPWMVNCSKPMPR